MRKIDTERVEELRTKLGNILHLAALDGRNDDVADLVDILSILPAAPTVSAEWVEIHCRQNIAMGGPGFIPTMTDIVLMARSVLREAGVEIVEEERNK